MKKSFFEIIAIVFLLGLIIHILQMTSVNADTFNGDRHGSGKHTAWYDSSIAAHGYTSHFDAARNYWNYKSSNVYIGKNSGAYTSYQDKYFVSTTAVQGLLGAVFPYQYSNQSSTVSDNAYWDYCELFIYENNMRSHPSYSDNSIKMNIAHEIGHTLKLAHGPTAYGSPMYESVMYEGFYPIYPSITSYDKQELRSKWGN